MNRKKQTGQVMLIVLVFMVIVLAFVSALVGYAQIQIRSHRQAVAKEQALNIAEAGIEKAVWKLNNETGYTGETGTVFGAGIYNVTVTNLSGSSKIVKAE